MAPMAESERLTKAGYCKRQSSLQHFPDSSFPTHFLKFLQPGLLGETKGDVMKNLRICLALAVLLVASASLAQDTTSSGKSKSKERTITGCLAQGDSSNKFVLNGNDGSTWDVKSDAVSLADHVGHTITAKGTVSNVTMHNAKEEAKDAATSAGMKKNNDEHGDMEIASVKMVSKSCK